MTPAIACPNCNAQLNTDDRFCAECGHPLSQPGVSLAEPQGGAKSDAKNGATSDVGAGQASGHASGSGAGQGPESPVPSAPQPAVSSGMAARAARQRTALLETVRHAIAGRYQLLSELGRGGMAVVYLANDPRLARRVAIKVMLPGLAMNEGMIERFELEARNAAQLEHEHIVTIYSVEDADDLAYFVMKYVDGVSLGDLLRVKGALPIAPLREALAQVANALDFAHRSKVVHRDVKPGNVMVDVRGHAVVTDFGISKGGSTNQQLTEVGAVVGTPPYMSPEQWRGDAASPASDQYALGVMLYELLTGAPPFRGNTMELSRQHLFELPPPIEEQREDCPREVVTLLNRLMAKNPLERFSSLEEVQVVLEAPPGPERRRAREELAALVAATRASSQAPENVPLPPTPEGGAKSQTKPAESEGGKTAGVTPTKIFVKYDREVEKTALQQASAETSQRHNESIERVATPEAASPEAGSEQSPDAGNDVASGDVKSGSLPQGQSATSKEFERSVNVAAARLETPASAGTAKNDSQRDIAIGVASPGNVVSDPSIRSTKTLPPQHLADPVRTKTSQKRDGRRGLVLGGVTAVVAIGAWLALRPANRGNETSPATDSPVVASTTNGTRNAASTSSPSDSLRRVSLAASDTLSTASADSATADSAGAKSDTVNSVAPPNEPPTPPKPTAPPVPTALAVAANVVVTDAPNEAMSVGERVRLRAQAKTAAGARMPNAAFTWRVEPSGIARVSARGELEALAPGSATVVVTSGKATARHEVQVIAATLASLKLFVLTPLRVGDTATFYVKATDQRGRPFPASDVTWNSSNDRVLSVDPRGVATARKKGGTKVRATLGALSTTLEVKVEERTSNADEERSGNTGGRRATPPAASATPATPTVNDVPPFSEAVVREQLQECLAALRKRDIERVRVLAATPVTGEASPLEQLLSVMRPKEGKFHLLNTDLSRPTRVAGARGTLDFRVRVGWTKSTGQDAETWLDYRALFEAKDGGWRMSWCSPQGNNPNLSR